MEQHAELVGLARTLFIIFAFYWGFKMFARYVLPFLLKIFVGYLGKKAQENMKARGYDTSGFNSSEEQVSDDGKVSIKKSAKTKSPSKPMDDVGDYVDFEEVE